MNKHGLGFLILIIILILINTWSFSLSEATEPGLQNELLVRDTTVPSQYRIKEGILWIPDEAFAGMDQIEAIIIPEGVIGIGSSAFFGCKNLKRVYLPESLLIIDTSAFQQCYKLSEIELPAHLYALGSLCFAETGISSIVIPESIRLIGDEAFVWTPINMIDIKSPYMEYLSDDLFDVNNEIVIYLPSEEYDYSEKLIIKYQDHKNIHFVFDESD